MYGVLYSERFSDFDDKKNAKIYYNAAQTKPCVSL